jgi:hypothetical protein
MNRVSNGEGVASPSDRERSTASSYEARNRLIQQTAPDANEAGPTTPRPVT